MSHKKLEKKQMNFFNIRELPKKEILNGIQVCSAFLKNVMLTYFEFEVGAKVPVHKHPHEQISLVLEGEMIFAVGKHKKTLKAGDGVTVPSQAEHSAMALSNVKVIDAWNPVRLDYIVDKEK